MDIEKIIMQGAVFKKTKEEDDKTNQKVKTKAKKTSYTKGAHGSGSAKMKAEYRRRRTERHKK